MGFVLIDRMKPIHAVLAAAGAALATFLLMLPGTMSRFATVVDARPMILSKVQSLGDLHAARHVYQNVYSFETSTGAPGWMKAVPGVDAISRAATRNKVLMSGEATVEASVDLSQATMHQSGTSTVIRIPKAVICPVSAKVRVENENRSLFFADRNLVVNATEDFKSRAARAAREEQILTQAEENAAEIVKKLLKQSNSHEILVEFA